MPMQNIIPEYDRPHALIETNYPGQFPEQMPIYLVLDWGKGEISVESKNYDICGTTFYEWHGHMSTYKLPFIVDATRLHDFVDEHILPIANRLHDAYESEWDGGNNVARFTGLEEGEALDLGMDLDQICTCKAPTYDGGGLWNVGDWLHDYAHETINADTSDNQLETMAEECKKEAESEYIVLVGDVLDYLTEVRDEMRSEAEED
ncbi:MAG: hypothetical protein KKB70_08995 [Proteobacteria bacterium]|nr:hypothetical protein [Pseudomonadota bacterium]MBU1610708.1 hypothetical protein [Pseudomonadota bacterium]